MSKPSNRQSPGLSWVVCLIFFIQAAKVLLMRPQNWPKFSFGVWLANAAPRMHRNKLATDLASKLARIGWSVLSTGKAFDTHRLELEAI